MSAARHPRWLDLPTVTSVDELESYGRPDAVVRDKVLPSLLPVHCDWLACAPLVFVATSTPDGRCDVSPKGDPGGLATVLDPSTVVLPERAGNKRMDGFHNILANPHIGLIFVIPGRGDTLRVNGVAQIVSDAPFFDDLVIKGHRPDLATVVHIEEVFFHCPKAFMRARTWDPASWDADQVMSYADIAKGLWRKGDDPAEVDAHYSPETYTASLYPS